MDVAFSAMTPNLYGSSRLSRAEGAMPLLVKDDVQASLIPEVEFHSTIFTEEEFQAMMLGQCDLMSFSVDDLQSPLFGGQRPPAPGAAVLRGRRPAPGAAVFRGQLQGPIADVLPGRPPQAVLRRRRPDPSAAVLQGRNPGDTRHAAADAAVRRTALRRGKKRKPTPSPISEDADADDEAEPAPAPPRPTKRARSRKKIKKAQLRAWHKRIAAHILRRRFRAPELSRGQTALRCQCHELALAEDPRGCALHHDAPEQTWMHSAQGHVPLVGGPDEVLVPTLSAGNGTGTVVRYARWRRSVWMPTRFYLQRAAERKVAGQREDDRG